MLSLAYVLWLALRILKLGFQINLSIPTPERPMSFTEAALFQWINGKAWQIVLMVATLYPAHQAEVKIMTAVAFIGILIVAGSFWIEAGKRIARYLKQPAIRKAYYLFLALALLLSTIPTGLNQLRAWMPSSEATRAAQR